MRKSRATFILVYLLRSQYGTLIRSNVPPLNRCWGRGPLSWAVVLTLSLLSSRSYLDMAKVLVFRHLFWLVLAVVFITGATRISIFGLGYLLASFFFLLFGTDLLVKPCRTRLNLWDCLIIYNVAVIISKNILSVSIISTGLDPVGGNVNKRTKSIPGRWFCCHHEFRSTDEGGVMVSVFVCAPDPGLCVCF